MHDTDVTVMRWPEPDLGLARKIADFQIGPQDVALTFNQRLMRECLWDAVYADRVAVEYRRFLYLLAISDQELTPSEAVDAAWHLHLSYTRSYWDELCGEIIKRPLHHNPTKGGEGEEHRFRQAYQRTFRLYWHIFDEAPPGDIWPDEDSRFAQAGEMRNVSAAQYYLIPRLPTVFERMLALALGCGAIFWSVTTPISDLVPFMPVLTWFEAPAALLVALWFFYYAAKGHWPKFKANVTTTNDGGCGGCGGCGG